MIYFFRDFTIFSENILWFHHFFANWLWINYIFREFAMNALSFKRFHYRFGEFPLRELPFRENTVDSLSAWPIHYEFTSLFRDSIMNWLCVPGIDYLLRLYTMNSPSISRIRYEFALFLANTLRIQFWFMVFRDSPWI